MTLWALLLQLCGLISSRPPVTTTSRLAAVPTIASSVVTSKIVIATTIPTIIITPTASSTASFNPIDITASSSQIASLSSSRATATSVSSFVVSSAVSNAQNNVSSLSGVSVSPSSSNAFTKTSSSSSEVSANIAVVTSSSCSALPDDVVSSITLSIATSLSLASSNGVIISNVGVLSSSASETSPGAPVPIASSTAFSSSSEVSPGGLSSGSSISEVTSNSSSSIAVSASKISSSALTTANSFSIESSASQSISSQAISSASILSASSPSEFITATKPSATFSSSSSSASATPPGGPITVSGKILVFARDSASAYSATSGLSGHGIPFELILVPSSGVALPVLNSTTTDGNYGGIIILGEVSYEGAAGFASALTAAQWQQMFDYQTSFGVRMVRLDVFPGPDFGTTTAIAGAGCCNASVEQLVSISNSTSFATAGLVTGATLNTSGLWHYPAIITDASTTWEIAQFGPSGSFTSTTTAAVINQIGERQQMAWFTSFATDWSTTSTFIQHSYIHWVTRGIFAGRRRIFFGTQVDDMHLSTGLYSPNGAEFRIRPADLDAHIGWQANLNTRLPPGSAYYMEIGHNGNGNIIAAVNTTDGSTSCNPATAIHYDEGPLPAPEFQKPIGGGTDKWPPSPVAYSWSLTCASSDDVARWFQVPANRDAFAHVSNTFAHQNLNNATYSDTNREIFFNKQWMSQVGIASGSKFSPGGLIPPSFSGLLNGDAIKAFMNNGITAVVGDNTRPVLKNRENEFWPLISTVARNGYDGLLIIPRWATTIFYNCDLPACTTLEWVETSGGRGDFTALLEDAKAVNTRHLLGLHHDPFMFHQANMRQTDVDSFTVGAQSGKMSLLQIWVETVAQEMTRLTTWPLISITHDNIAQEFTRRMTRDKCAPSIKYTLSADASSIVSVDVGASGNSCPVPLPLTLPVDATTTASGTTSEQIGSDPVVKWSTLSGSTVTWTLSSPLKL